MIVKFVMNPPKTKMFLPLDGWSFWSLWKTRNSYQHSRATLLWRFPLRNTVLHFWPAKLTAATPLSLVNERVLCANITLRKWCWCQMKSAAHTQVIQCNTTINPPSYTTVLESCWFQCVISFSLIFIYKHISVKSSTAARALLHSPKWSHSWIVTCLREYFSFRTL